ncbi:MAG: alpha/beta hydrolase [Aggregatilineales bacterium]
MAEKHHDLPFHVEMVTGVQYGTADDGKPLLLDLAYPKETPGMPAPEKTPVIIEVHGGGWHLGERSIGRGLLMPLQGYFYASIDYRMSYEAIFPAQIHDVKAAIRWVRAHANRYNLDADRIGLYGGSAGGHLVTLAGCTGDLAELEGHSGWEGYSTRVQAVAAVNPPTDMSVSEQEWAWLYQDDGPAEWLFGGRLQDHTTLVRSSGAMNYANEDAPPYLLIHGTKDDIVPFSQASMLHNRLCDLGVESTLVAFNGIDHALYGYTVQVWEHVMPFFKKHLGYPINYGKHDVVTVHTERI